MGSVWTMGIGRLYASVGYFYNQILGSYKAYATHDLNTVVMVLGRSLTQLTKVRFLPWRLHCPFGIRGNHRGA